MKSAVGQRFPRKLSDAFALCAVCLLLQSFGDDAGVASFALAKPSAHASSKSVPLDEKAMRLVDLLAHNPELMNLDYLRYNLGYPAKYSAGIGTKTYYWHSFQSGKDEVPQAELTQMLDSKNRVTEPRFAWICPHPMLN